MSHNSVSLKFGEVLTGGSFVSHSVSRGYLVVGIQRVTGRFVESERASVPRPARWPGWLEGWVSQTSPPLCGLMVAPSWKLNFLQKGTGSKNECSRNELQGSLCFSLERPECHVCWLLSSRKSLRPVRFKSNGMTPPLSETNVKKKKKNLWPSWVCLQPFFVTSGKNQYYISRHFSNPMPNNREIWEKKTLKNPMCALSA